MTAIIKDVPQFLGRLLIWRAFLYVMTTVCSATLAALTGLDWSSANGQTRFMVTIGVLGVVGGTLGAFIDQSAQRVAKGETPFVDVPNETPAPGTIKKTEIHTEQKTTETTPPATQ